MPYWHPSREHPDRRPHAAARRGRSPRPLQRARAERALPSTSTPTCAGASNERRCHFKRSEVTSSSTLTTMPDAGVDLRDVQIAARHADPRTTMRYDRARNNLDRHPHYTSPRSWPQQPDDRSCRTGVGPAPDRCRAGARPLSGRSLTQVPNEWHPCRRARLLNGAESVERPSRGPRSPDWRRWTRAVLSHRALLRASVRPDARMMPRGA